MSNFRLQTSRCTFAAATILLSLLVGCGADINAVPVRGRVTLDGKPLAGAHLSFEPVAQNLQNASFGSYATTDADGQFALKLVANDARGAMAGEHLVRITTARAENPSQEGSPISPERVPAHYRDGLHIEVPAGGSDAVAIDLTSQLSASR